MKLIVSVETTETYTFYPNDGTPEINILSGQLRDWLHSRVMDRVIDLHFPEQSLEDIVQAHGLEPDRMASMTEEEAKEPVIVGLYPNGVHILIDGGHRRWYWAKRGVNVLRGWAVPEEVWRSFTYDPSTMPGLHGQDGSLLPQRRK